MKLVRNFLFFLLGLALCACGFKNKEASKSQIIFGDDNRTPITSSEKPWAAIGRLSTGCTGALIGKRLVLTAAHCVFKRDGKLQTADLSFFPNTIHNQARDMAHTRQIWAGTTKPYSDSSTFGADWAILLIDRDLGSQYGYFHIMDVPVFAGELISIAGYSGDYDNGRTATLHKNCQIQPPTSETSPHTFFHDCDVVGGASGAPVLASFSGSRELYIVGVESGERNPGGRVPPKIDSYDPKYANVAVEALAFAPTAETLIQTHD